MRIIKKITRDDSLGSFDYTHRYKLDNEFIYIAHKIDICNKMQLFVLSYNKNNGKWMWYDMMDMFFSVHTYDKMITPIEWALNENYIVVECEAKTEAFNTISIIKKYTDAYEEKIEFPDNVPHLMAYVETFDPDRFKKVMDSFVDLK
jgi:hypothetical protein